MIDQAGVRTYRNLRLGLVLAVLALGGAILRERAKVDCWQTSISGYYYTPVRGILVALFIASGFALIAIRGRTRAINVLLNAAGCAAVVTALVPSPSSSNCWSVAPSTAPIGADGTTMNWIDANIDLMLEAVLAAGLIALLATVILLAASRRSRGIGWTDALVLVALVVLILGLLAAWVMYWNDFGERIHSLSLLVFAVTMSLAMLLNGAATLRSQPGRRSRFYGCAYITLAVLPVLSLPILMLLLRVDQSVLIFETVVVVSFAVFWGLQATELWNEMAPPFQPVDADTVRANLDPDQIDAMRSGIPEGSIDRDGAEPASWDDDPQPTASFAFIAYPREEERYVNRLASYLESKGVPVWYDRRLKIGERWERRLLEQVAESSAFVIVSTPDAEGSEFLGREVVTALDTKKQFFPILLRGHPMDVVAPFQMEDLRNGGVFRRWRMPSHRFVKSLREHLTTTEMARTVASQTTHSR